MVIAFLACAGLLPARAAEWNLVKHGGRDYVSIDNVASFYELGKVQRVGNSATAGTSGRALRAERGSSELFINNLKFILSYPVLDEDGTLLVSRMDLTKVIEPVLRPSRIQHAEKVDTVVLDPGHGGHDRGATCQWGAEKDFNLDVARRARKQLEAQGMKVVMTRNSDVFIPLDGRVRFANKHENAIFISIHFNSGQSAAAGIETFTLAPRGVPSHAADGPRVSDLQLCKGNSHDAANMALATATHATLVSRLRPFDRGIKRARFVVIRDINLPGVLIEGGFLSNPGESRRIASPTYRELLATAIAAAVQNYRKSVGPRVPDSIIGPLVELNPAAAPPPVSSDAPTVVTPTAH